MIYYVISFILILISISISIFLYQVPTKELSPQTPDETTPEVSSEILVSQASTPLPINNNEGKISAPTVSYKFYQGMDPGPFDIPGQQREAIDNIEQLKRLCNEDPTCIAFNTNGWLKWNMAPRTQWARWTEDSKKGMYIKDTIEILPKSNEWQCLSNIKTPLLLNNTGDVQCMSLNRKDCLWSDTITQCNNIINENKNKTSELKPLVCGEMHKNITGSLGYDNPNHWCSKGKTILS